MADIKKPEDIGAKLQTISSKVNAETLPKIASAYNVGKARDFSAKQANLAKYATYGSETFGKLGFDPFKASHTSGKSGMDELYDEKTSWTADIGRAYTGMKKLAGIGLQDTFALGAFADSGNYLSFEDTMNKYSSSRGGNTGFWSNTMLSSGYTMGIIGGIAAEELALAGITALSGGTAAPATIAAGGSILARGVAKIKGGMSMLQSVNKLQDLNTAKGFLGSTGKFVGGGLKGFGKALNPLENTFDFLKTIDKLEDFNGWKQTAIGAGAVVRDARKITMSHSESKLEADLASKEFRQQMYDEYYTDKSKIGTEIPESQLKLIDDEANKVKDRVYAANFGLIYVTNAITFDNMFKNMKGTNRWATVANDAYRISKKEGGKVAVDVLAKTFGNAIRKKVGSITLGGSIKSAISSSMEGFQELGQDAISESMKSYHARNVKGTQVRGGFMEYLHNDLATAADKLQSGEGLSTFLSGALMGVFASPVGFATGQVNNFLANGGAQKIYQRTFDNKKWKAEKLSLEVKRKEKARVLTEFFNNNKNFIDGFSKPIYSQNELQEQILQAAEDKNQKGFKNAQHDSFVTGVHTLLEAGLENEFADHLEYMSKNFGAKELNEVFGRTDITEENKARYQAKLQTQATNVKQLRAKYNEIQNNIVNPNSMKGAKVTDPDYLEKYIKWRSVENLKKELLFSDSKIADRANRIEVLKKEINDDTPLSSLEVNSLLDESALEQQIELLETEVKANDGLTLTGKGAENLEKAKLKLEAFKVYQEKLKAYTSENKKEDGTVYESDAYDDLFEAYNGLMQAFGKNTLGDKNAQTEKNKKQFDKVFDYISLGEENKYYQEFVDTLLNPAGASAYLKGQEDMLKRLDESKEDHIANALKAFEEKSTADDMLNALYNEGLFFDLNELDDLIKNRMMPSEIFDIEDNNKSASPEQTKVAQEIIEKFIKRLTGKSIINDKTTLNKQGRKFKSDKRTLAGIMRQYNIKLGQEVNLSSKAGQRLLEKMMAKENKFLTRLDREILAKLGEQDATIKFVTDGTLPVQMNEDGVIVLDLRFAGRDFKNSVMSVENLIVTGLTQNKIANELKSKDDLWLAARNAMEQAKEQFKRAFPSQNIDEVEVFSDPVLFLTEAMNDIQFQKFLGQIEDNIQPASKSLWDTLMTGVEEIVNEDFDKKLANRVINIAAKALDDSIVDNIAEEDTEAKEVKEEKTKAKTEKFDELTTLAKELGLRWNVNVKVVANKEEAEKILGGIENPFFESEGDGPSGFYDEKTNTAYIVADSVKPGTVYHEIFLHPFLINLEKTNPEFYKKLVDEAKSDQEAIDYVNKNYGTAADLGVRQYEHEIVGRVYNKSINNQLDKTKNPGLFKIIGQFIKKMLTSVGDYFGINKTDIKRFNEKKTTIADLAKYSVTGTGKVDLGKVLEAEDIIQGTAAKTPKTRKVQRERVITKEETVNTGGNIVILDNAADRPDLFDEFLHPEIVFGNRLASSEWTDKIVKLGQELDAGNVTDWEYGDIRAQIDGRLIVDVTAKVNGKTVRFLMYKSTGKGTTLNTKGEWVPLLAIGTLPDGGEWFVKDLYKGSDPKINKYGSEVFLAIDQDLKAKEADLFTEAENWVTQEVEETITEEVEEEVTEEEVPPTAEEAARTQASYVNEAESIKNKINQIQNQLDKYNQELADSKLTFVQKRTARRKVTELSIELNELYQRLNDIQPELDAFKADGTFEDPELEYAPRYDYNGNEVITHETPWPSVPKDLREAIALLYGKPLSKITQEDVISIREEMKTNPVYIGLVSDFTENRLQEQNAQLGEKELEENRKKTEAAKEARRQQLLDEQEESRTAKKQRRQLQTPITDEEFLKNILKDLDFSILTSKEMSMLIDKFKNRTAANPYGVNDIIAYISNKTAEEEKKKLRRKLLDDNKKMQAQKKIDKQITENLKALRTKKLSYSDAKNKTINLRITNEMVRFIATYHSDIFAQDSASFAQSVDAILQKRKSELAKLKSQPISFKPKAVHLQLMTLIKKLEKNKTLYPETVYQINLALYKLNSDLRVKMIRQGKAAPLSTMYEIGKKSKSENRTPFGKTPTKYSEKKKAILNFDLTESTFADEKNTEIAILQKLIQGEKVEKDEADSVLLKYKNLANAVDKVSSDIANAVPVNEMDSDIDLSEEEQQALLNLEEQGMTKEEAEAELSNLKFMSSPEGQELLDKEAEALSQYYDSVQAEIINGEFEGDENDLSDEDIDLLNSTEKEEAVEPEADNAELANDLANAEIELPFDNEEVDLNENPKSLKSEIEMLHTELINDKPFYVTNYTYAGTIFDNLNKGKFGDLVYAIAAHRYMTAASYNPGQLKGLNFILLDKFRTGVFTDKVVNIEGTAYRISGFQENKITLQDLQSLEEIKLDLDKFMNNVIEVLKPGAEFNSVNIDTVVNVAEFDYIKDAYDEILNNFTSFMGEANSLSEEDLMVDLNKEITKCK
jgi:hypothetical protein